MYSASENKSKITYKELVNKISSIGEYFSQREAHHKEWYRSIKPLYGSAPIDAEALSEEFYQGVSARFTHVQAELDIRRVGLFEKLDALLKNSRTVIIHGASGQGKSTLAYRYLHDNAKIPFPFTKRQVNKNRPAFLILCLYLFLLIRLLFYSWFTFEKINIFR